MSFLFVVLISQFIVIVFIIFILNVVLNKMLVDIAIKHLEVWRLSEGSDINQVVFVTHKPMTKTLVQRIHRAAKKNFSPTVLLDFQVQRSILGGAIVHVGDRIFDCSLKDRLSQAMGMK